ncbi:MAG: hypothetical protein C5B56_01380 [Proteobacteria bacterium]|nr:MAG: hypothetical protein C5B56_01380 [Pseudomonadota bacterium]
MNTLAIYAARLLFPQANVFVNGDVIEVGACFPAPGSMNEALHGLITVTVLSSKFNSIARVLACFRL